jgi:hypothetical protein
LAAHLGLGIAVARRWAVALPCTLCALLIASFVVRGDTTGLDWIFVFLLVPALAAVTAIGVAIGRRLSSRRLAVAAGCYAVALLPTVWGTIETLERGPHVSPALQAQLPTFASFANLCGDGETRPELERRLRASAAVLIRELRRRPNDLVTYTHYSEEGPDENRDIAVRELAEEQLGDMHNAGGACPPGFDAAIRAAM